jgi:hypothetical protein
LDLVLHNMTCELKTYRLTKEGRRAYRGKLCVSPYLGQDTYASLVDTIATPEDSFELPAAALPFRSVEEVRTKDGMGWMCLRIQRYILYL